jgi:hypothetical protein
MLKVKRKNNTYSIWLLVHLLMWLRMRRKLASITCKWNTHQFKWTLQVSWSYAWNIWRMCPHDVPRQYPSSRWLNILRNSVKSQVYIWAMCPNEHFLINFITLWTPWYFFDHLLYLFGMEEVASGSGSSFNIWNN